MLAKSDEKIMLTKSLQTLLVYMIVWCGVVWRAVRVRAVRLRVCVVSVSVSLTCVYVSRTRCTRCCLGFATTKVIELNTIRCTCHIYCQPTLAILLSQRRARASALWSNLFLRARALFVAGSFVCARVCAERAPAPHV